MTGPLIEFDLVVEGDGPGLGAPLAVRWLSAPSTNVFPREFATHRFPL